MAPEGQKLNTSSSSSSSFTKKEGMRGGDQGITAGRWDVSQRVLTFLLRRLLIHSLTRGSFVEHLLCARPRNQGHSGDCDRVSAPEGSQTR